MLGSRERQPRITTKKLGKAQIQQYNNQTRESEEALVWSLDVGFSTDFGSEPNQFAIYLRGEPTLNTKG